jgi:hypothetical protein
MYKNSIILFAALISILYFGCSGQKDLTNVNEGDIPPWYINTPVDPNFIFAAKTEVSQDMQLAVDKATNSARAEIGRSLEVKMNGLEKQFKEEIGEANNSTLLQQFTQATKSVMSTTLNGSSIKEKQIKKEGNVWRAYVLVQYPLGEANQALMNQIQKNNEMYTRFRSTQTFDELDKEVKQYEESKNKPVQ